MSGRGIFTTDTLFRGLHQFAAQHSLKGCCSSSRKTGINIYVWALFVFFNTALLYV